MTDHSQGAVVGAVAITATAILSAGVIALGFLIPERLFDSTIGLAAFLLATLLMVACAVAANRYDLRGILVETFG